jgi:D-alanine-D-alanine ligase
VKSTTEDASLGISQASIVTDKAQLKERIEFVHDQVQTDALVEEYIEGASCTSASWATIASRACRCGR